MRATWLPGLCRCIACAFFGTLLLLLAAFIAYSHRGKLVYEIPPAFVWLQPLTALAVGFGGIILCLIAFQSLLRVLSDCCRATMPPLCPQPHSSYQWPRIEHPPLPPLAEAE